MNIVLNKIADAYRSLNESILSETYLREIGMGQQQQPPVNQAADSLKTDEMVTVMSEKLYKSFGLRPKVDIVDQARVITVRLKTDVYVKFTIQFGSEILKIKASVNPTASDEISDTLTFKLVGSNPESIIIEAVDALIQAINNKRKNDRDHFSIMDNLLADIMSALT